MGIPQLKIGTLKPKFPVIQGGMGVGVSLHGLASAVANSGGIGIISGAQIGFKEPDFIKNTLEANLNGLEKEIKLAKERSPEGIIGLNLMVAMKNYASYVKKAVECKIDLIISGAGLPLDLPELVKGSNTLIAPIVSSAKAARIICKRWEQKNQYTPDAIIVEGPLAGGHLGFHKSELDTPPLLKDLIQEVRLIADEYGKRHQKYIPVIAAGGIYTGEDVAEAIAYGADGVQMATRFVTTHECDADIAFKQAYIDATIDEVGVVPSPVGMPGRAVLNPFISNPQGNKACFYHCLHDCNVTEIPYCISKALINAANGEMDDALIFCGSNAYKATKLEAVDDIFKEIEASFQ